jgi:hypothetical protein
MQVVPRGFVAAFGDMLLRRQALIRRAQWVIISAYVFLLAAPLLLPLPRSSDFIWNNLSRFAQFAFWGVWWPFVVLATALVGRFWCGLLCPEGALSEFASERGAARAIPGWMKWSGWPVVSFIATTVYGQLTSIYQYPKPAALLLGGSTFAAMIVGARYGKAKRIWCRFLCPVSGVFGLVSKLAPLHFQVEPEAWRRSARADAPAVNCAPLVPIKTMQGASACHMCGRCSGHRGAIRLAWRKPAMDIIYGSGRRATSWETILIVPVLLGVVPAALHWSSSAIFQALRQWLVELCVDAQWIWPLSLRLPWWILTNYPSVNDVMTVADGLCLLVLILLGCLSATILFIGPLAASSLVLRRPLTILHHLAQALIPLAAASLFAGLLSLTITQLHADGVVLPHADQARAAAILVSALWSLRMFSSITGIYTRAIGRRVAATALVCIPITLFCIAWLIAFLS